MPRDAFMLSQWTVEQRGSYWYYGDPYRDEKAKFKGPYSSLASVTLMLGRELLKEVQRRQKRMVQPPSPAE
jgi:hypothetical protein